MADTDDTTPGSTDGAFPIREVIVYGAFGVGAAALVYLLTGYGTHNIVLVGLDAVFAATFMSALAWTFWMFIIPAMAGKDGIEN